MSVDRQSRALAMGALALAASALAGAPRGGQIDGGRDQLFLDEVEYFAARVARVGRELGGRDDRHAAEEVHQDVVEVCPQRPRLGDDSRLVRNGRALECGQEEVRSRDTLDAADRETT